MCVCVHKPLKLFHLITPLKVVKMILDLGATSQNLPQIRLIQSYGCDFTLTAAFAAELLSSAYQRRPPIFPPPSTASTPPPPPPLAPGIRRDAGGLAGSAAVSIISVTCPARRPAAPPAIRLGVYSGGRKYSDSVGCGWRPADQRASPPADRPPTTHHHHCHPVFRAVTQSRPKLDELVCNFFFFPTNLSQFVGV